MLSGLHQYVDFFPTLRWIYHLPNARGKTPPCPQHLCGENSFKINQGTNTTKLFCQMPVNFN